MHRKKRGHSAAGVMLFSLAIGLILFFSNATDLTRFTENTKDPYLFFAQNIYKANYTYLSESLLMPLLANLVGATSSPQAFYVFTAFLTILILPILSYLSVERCGTMGGALIVIAFFSSFNYLHKFWLGFPDALTITLLCVIPFLKNPVTLFIFALLAALSHFSMSVLCLFSLCVLIYFGSNVSSVHRLSLIKSILAGLITGKIFLQGWYAAFDYRINSRLDIVSETGISFYLNNYEQIGFQFWLIPGLNFLFFYLIILVTAVLAKNYGLFFSGLVAIMLAYLAVFFTTDGLRIFSVVISGSYVFLLINLTDRYQGRVRGKVEKFLTQDYLIEFINLGHSKITIYSLIAAISWLCFIAIASRNGLLLNSQWLHQEDGVPISPYKLLAVAVCLLIFFGISHKDLRRNLTCKSIVISCFTLPMTVVLIQVFRKFAFPEESLPTFIKALALAPTIVIIYYLRGSMRKPPSSC
jgi:hypothetical protein